MSYLFETARLSMRLLAQDDWQMFHHLNSDEQGMKYIRDIGDDKAIRDKFELALAPWTIESNCFLMLCIIEQSSGDRIGTIGIYPRWQPSQQAEVGYMFLSQYQGKGYAFEALTAMVSYAFKQYEFHKIIAQVHENNIASEKLLIKAGFIQEGLLRDNHCIGGQWINDKVFGLLQSEKNRNNG